MCGILGGNIKNWNYEKGIMKIKHRGPDAQKVIKHPLCNLAFARLSIMDISMNAMQPMMSTDENVTIVFNGEIYGYTELKNELKKKYIFRTTSDTEVILYSYIEYGDKFIDLIDGMFAIVIYDKREEVLKVYRDRYGIKPLYYYYNDKEFAFASEIKALLAASEDKKWEVDNTAIYDYLCYQYVPEPKSIYKDIYKLEPANYLVYDLQKKKIIKKDRYWRLRVCTRAEGKRKQSEIVEDIRYLITKSVKQQMIADVEVGTFLSGGIDSSIITYECSKYNKNIAAYSIGFREKKFDEISYTKLLVSMYDIRQNVKILEADDIKNLNGKLREWYDEPFGDTSAFPTFLVSKFARNTVKVVLTGDGGDEIFGGYRRYQMLCKELEKGGVINSKLFNDILNDIKFKNPYFQTQLSAYSNYLGIFDKEREKIFKNKYGINDTYDSKWYIKKYYVSDLPVLTRLRYLDFKTYLPSDILTKVDRASMSISLEARVPFLSREIVEYVFGLAENECCNPNCLKQLLKEAYKEVIPEEILYRQKKGFSIPKNYIYNNSRSISNTEEILRREWNELYRR